MPTVESRKDYATPAAYLSALALVVGSFMPWGKITAPIVGSVSKSGMEGSDGWATLTAGIVVAALAYGWSKPGARVQGYVMMVVGTLAVILMMFEYDDVARIFSDVDSDLVSKSYGVGLHLCTIGAVASVLAGFLRLARADRELASRDRLDERPNG